jgi:prophage regulatory protein
MNNSKIFRIAEVCHSTGLSHSSLYKQIRLGHFPKGVKITSRATGWPENEILKINEGRIAGLSDSEMLELVQELEAARKNGGAL